MAEDGNILVNNDKLCRRWHFDGVDVAIHRNMGHVQSPSGQIAGEVSSKDAGVAGVKVGFASPKRFGKLCKSAKGGLLG